MPRDSMILVDGRSSEKFSPSMKVPLKFPWSQILAFLMLSSHVCFYSPLSAGLRRRSVICSSQLTWEQGRVYNRLGLYLLLTPDSDLRSGCHMSDPSTQDCPQNQSCSGRRRGNSTKWKKVGRKQSCGFPDRYLTPIQFMMFHRGELRKKEKTQLMKLCLSKVFFTAWLEQAQCISQWNTWLIVKLAICGNWHVFPEEVSVALRAWEGVREMKKVRG